MNSKLETIEEVVAMDKYKYNLAIELTSLDSMRELNLPLVSFLLENDKVFEEATWSSLHELHFWPQKLAYLMDEADERHKAERATLEIELLKRKDEFERDTLNFEIDVQSQLPTWTELYSYRLYMPRVHAIKERFDSLNATASELESQESMLLGFKCHTIVSFIDLRALLLPTLNLWLVASDVLVLKRSMLDALQQGGQSGLNLEKVKNVLSQAKEQMQKHCFNHTAPLNTASKRAINQLSIEINELIN